MVLKADSEFLEKWTNIQIPIYIKFFFFNIQNPYDVEFESKKPILKQIGPYTFLEKRNKNIIQFLNDAKELVFNERRRYFFESNLSIGGLDDLIVLPNIPKLIMASKAINDDSEDAAVNFDIIDAMFRKLDPPLFENYTVDQILFKGFKVELFEEMKATLKEFNFKVPDEIKDGEFGLFYKVC